jgi:outer membrane protein TolC
LQLTNQQIQLNRVNNNILVVNHDLCVKLGLNANTIIDVDTLLYHQFFNRTKSQNYNDSSYTNALDIALSRKNIELAKRQVNIAHSQQFPTLSLYVSGALDRPSLNSNPPVDIYTDIFQVGLKLKYNIGSLYTAKKHIEKSEMDYNMAQTQQQWTEQSVEMASHQAYIRIHDAWDKYHSLEESFALAQDNYQVVEQKYLNKFSTITDVLDAATALLSSELDMNNAKVDIIYQWFSFMKITGNWENRESEF